MSALVGWDKTNLCFVQARAEADDLMQKQFDAIADLLTDDYPIVRLAAVEGCVGVTVPTLSLLYFTRVSAMAFLSFLVMTWCVGPVCLAVAPAHNWPPHRPIG